MLSQLEELKAQALHELESIESPKELESWRVRYLGKKSNLTGMLRGLATLPLEERKTIGALANEIKIELEENFRRKEPSLRRTQLTPAKSKTQGRN